MGFSSYFTVVLLLEITFFIPQIYALTCSNPSLTTDSCDDNCNELGVCQSDGILIPHTNCQELGQVCDLSDNTCQSNPGMECGTAQKGKCATPGKYPSLTDCTSYYECTSTGEEVYAKKCGGKAYNSCTKECTDSLINGRCSTAAITCAAGLKGPAPGNDNLYYVCVYNGNAWIPQWQQCTGNTRYSVSAGGCKYVGSISGCTTCGAASNVPGPIPMEGTNCSYIWCKSRQDFVVKQCTVGWHYDHSERGCVYGSCS